MIKNNIYRLISLLSGILFFLNISAQDSIRILWEKANSLYAAEEYQKAILEYEQIIDAGQESAKLYFNLGNAYYKTGDINNAVLNYERARLLAPQDEDIEFNLRMANQFVVTAIEELPQPFFIRWKKEIINKYPADIWASLSIGLFIIFLLLLGAFLFSRSASIKKFSFWFGIIALIVTVFTFSFAANQKEKINRRNHAIVLCPRVTVKSAPSVNSTDLFLLYEGVKVEISDSLDIWTKIKLSDGNLGWLPDSCIVRI